MKLRVRLSAVLMVSLAGQATAGGAADSLYSRLGGADRVTAIVSATMIELAENAPDGQAPAGSDTKSLCDDLATRICAVAGGGCRYRGTQAPDTELVEALRSAMRAHGVPLAVRNELLDALTARHASTVALNPRK